MTIYFYSTTEEPYGCFSNFSRHGIELDGKFWKTSEHYFQAQKFVGTPHAEEVRRATTPKEAARLGRDRKRPLRPDWEGVKDGVMRRAVLKKFESHPALRELLLGTGEEELVENTTGDYYWGCGKDGSGRNMLGKILMEIRAQLRQGEPREAAGR
jgi:N-glycosidase YbiA